ncbi:MAG: DUF3160 domain-containing protein [Ignavibacteriaceae bacterium]|nr:DUF3160 domain-containing protein [Ignavibacteriaceae bacterium]NUM70642.1 DUF3160 domain-containing protein [Ignavibacteriaceae bacterium]
MKRLLLNTALIFLLILNCSELFSQQSFDTTAFREFLNQTANIGYQELQDMHPAGDFLGNIQTDLSSVLYLDSIISAYQLTGFERSLIKKHGFMVTERLTRTSFGSAFLDVFHKDFPVYVSTDAILHSIHSSYEQILAMVELGYLRPQLVTMLDKMRTYFPQLAAQYQNDTGMTVSLKDADLYIGTARKLLDLQPMHYFPENNAKCDDILQKIENLEMIPYTLFASTCREIDFSQFRPRSHYAQLQELRTYFKSMMWLSRIEFYLLKPRALPYICPAPTNADIKRQVIDSYLIKELLIASTAVENYNNFENVIKFFVGEQDNVTIPNLLYLQNAAGFSSANQLLDSTVYNRFRDSLVTQDFAYQKILSQVLYSPGLDSIIPASAFMLLGQRFIVDSYVLSQVVYDRIKYNGIPIKRMLPKTLDAMFAIGNNAAGRLLKPEIQEYHYAPNLAAQRYLINAYEPEFWMSSIYNIWLNSIRLLNPPKQPARDSLPSYMRTAAFWQYKLNTQLTAWTQLRHDNLLYGKQSYTGGTICSFPYSYVEPFPQFYMNLKLYATDAKTRFNQLPIDPSLKTEIIRYYTDLYNISDTLHSIVKKELAGEQFAPSEITFLHNMIYLGVQGYGEIPYKGWYPRLFFNVNNYSDGLLSNDFLVADFHTAPTDAAGNVVGWVMHAGTGKINLGVWVIPDYQNQYVAYVGPSFSYHEYTTTNFLRLTDDEWETQYFASSTRPDFVNLYLAGANGENRGDGSTLLTSVEDEQNPGEIASDYKIYGNHPNPFNPETIISYSVPAGAAGLNTSLRIFDITGKEVTTILSGNLQPGNYMTKWTGTDSYGKPVSSGVYIVVLSSGNMTATHKITLLK